MKEYNILTDAFRAILNTSTSGNAAIKNIAQRLSADLPASVFVSDVHGQIVAEQRLEHFNPLDREIGESLDSVLADSLGDMSEDLINIPMEELPVRTASKTDIKEYTVDIFPITVFSRRAGSLIAYRRGGSLNEDERSMCVCAACFLGLIMSAMENEVRLDVQRKRETVRVVKDSLSYSELMVSATIFKELNGSEGIIVASRIADAEGITRSVIVNAIRKLESAGVLESRSLGMKGTYIKVINEYFSAEIEKIKKNAKTIEKMSENC